MNHKFFYFFMSLAFFTIQNTFADTLPGMGKITGSVKSDAPFIAAQIDLHHIEKEIIYTVFSNKGQFRAVNLFPGRYEITVRKKGFEEQSKLIYITADGSRTSDFYLKSKAEPPTYVRGINLPDTKPVPYDILYPEGKGRDIVEKACNVCHGPNYIPSLPQPREAWDGVIDRMINQTSWMGLGIEDGMPSAVPPEIFDEGEREILLDYLSEHFHEDTELRAVQKEIEPILNENALGKAMFIEYRFVNTDERPHRWTQEIQFDRSGNVWVTERGSKPGIVWLDPRTGEYKDYLDPDPKGSPHGLAVDFDGTVWWAGRNVFLAHLDPKSGKIDQYAVTQFGFHGHTPVFASNGDLWFSMLPSNKIGQWNRKSDTIKYYEAPVSRARPYGFIIDKNNKIWFAEYHTSAVTRFDPLTEKFERFPVLSKPASIRRLGIDSKGIVWFGVYGSPDRQGKLGRVDPKTGQVKEMNLPVEFSNPYDAWADDDDNIWVSTDNYLIKYVQEDDLMTLFPTPTRTDMPKMSITREGAIWFTPRNAGLYGKLGGAASVLYPDMDSITTLGAYYSSQNTANNLSDFQGSSAIVKGIVKISEGGKVSEEEVRGEAYDQNIKESDTFNVSD